MTELMRIPFPVTYRELWLPEHIRSTQMPGISGGNALTITGGAKRTTADGVRFDGTANGFVDLGVIHSSQAKLWISLRFRLDQAFAAGSGDQYLFSKTIDNDDRLDLRLNSSDGTITWMLRLANVTQFTIASPQTFWSANIWYHVMASISSVNGARLRIDNGTAVTAANLSAAPAGGNVYIGKRSFGGAADSLKGTMTDIAIGIDDLTLEEEQDCSRGVFPTDTVHFYTCDEGRGVTLNDRGTGPANGTLGSAASWAFGQVVQPVLSHDGLNDYARTTTTRIDNNMTCVYVGKMKRTGVQNMRDASGVLRTAYWRIGSTAFNRVIFISDTSGAGYNCTIGGTTQSGGAAFGVEAIDNYAIYIATINSTVGKAYKNGYQAGNNITVDAMLPNVGGFTLGNEHTGTSEAAYGKALSAATIEGAMTPKQVRIYSRWLRDMFNLPITI